MTNMKRAAMLGLAVLLSGAISAQRMPKGKVIMSGYDPAKEVTIQGTVEGVVTAEMGHMRGVAIRVKTTEKIFNVRLGLAAYLEEKKFKFATGDQVQVTGSQVRSDNVNTIIAREVKKGDAVLVLRDAKGMPLWAGRREYREGLP